MNEILKRIEGLPPIKSEGEVVQAQESALAERKRINAVAMRDAVLTHDPDALRRKEESDKMRQQAKEAAMERLGIREENLGDASKETNRNVLQERAAKKHGYGSAQEMREKGIVQRKSMMERSRAWLRETLGVAWPKDEEPKNKKNAA